MGLMGTSRTYACSTFDVIMFKAILRLSSPFVSNCPVTLNHLTVKRNRIIGYVKYLYGVVFWVIACSYLAPRNICANL